MFKAMPLLLGIGDEVLNFFIVTILFAVIYVAWRSTNVREDRFQRTAVLIIENNRRRLIDRVAQHPVTISILRSTSRQESTASNATGTEEIEVPEDGITNHVEDVLREAPAFDSVLEEINNLNMSGSQNVREQQESNMFEINHESSPELGPEQIIQEMDHEVTSETNGLRRRRVDYFNSNTTDLNTEVDSVPVPKSDILIPDKKDDLNEIQGKCKLENEIRIKLKYLNDDLKLVKGSTSEAIGDFKKRNFTVELAAQKIVRLVFNGHVLQPDSKTLQSCGLFDNCVVHCLVHNSKQPAATGTAQQTNPGQGQEQLPQTPREEERNTHGSLLIYLGMILISLTLLFCWWCRFQYNYLFSWYSTSGLIILTILFFIMIPLIVLVERGTTDLV